jgi:hypothetical protein
MLVGIIRDKDRLFAGLEPRSAEADRVFDEEVGPVIDEWFHPEFELRSRIGAVEGGRVYVGREGTREWTHDILSAFSAFERDVQELEEVAPGTVLGRQRTHIVGRGSELDTEMTFWVVARFEGGRVRTTAAFVDRDEALTFARAVS